MNRNKILAEKASNLISSNISLLGNIGIDHFGYREFIEDGSSIGFCTHQNWSNLQNKMHIIDDMSIHYKRELIEIGDNRTKYLVRCGEVKNQSYFLNVLNNWKLWNSLVIYKREHNKICGYYFISSNENMSVINSYMNNLSFIENIINIIKPKIQSLVKNCGKEFYEQLFDRSEANLIINNKVTMPNSKTKNCVLDKDYYKNSRLFSFSEKQKKIIYLLMQKFSNKKIAKDLGISPRTAEWHIERIKIKTEVKCKQELINFLLTYTFEL